jgi:glycerol-3-phosphate acyltransferase PlsX
MRIGLDVMGGDFAPQYPLEGVKLALDVISPEDVLCLIGNEEMITSFLAENGLTEHPQIKVIPASQVIEMGEHATQAMKTKPDSSIIVGYKMLTVDKIDVFISAGNTGAVYVGALFTVKAIAGISRPAIMSIIPKTDGSMGVILDVGANSDCKPETLVQFAMLGSIYAKSVLGIQNPKVGLLNIGSEPEKGNLASQGAYTLLTENNKVNFIGNIEGYDFFTDKSDVIVTDGFTGNIILKTAEAIFSIIKEKGINDDYFKMYDLEHIGGTPLLGVNKPVIIAHGNSTPLAFRQMIVAAKQVVQSDLINNIKLAFQTELING